MVVSPSGREKELSVQDRHIKKGKAKSNKKDYIIKKIK